MSLFARNLLANLAGTGWSALVQLAAVPVLVSLVGVAAFALVGFHATLVAALAILDLGLSPSLTRRMAGVRLAGADRERAADSLRSYEVAFWIVGALLGAVLALCAPAVARHWLSSSSLATGQVEDVVRLMGLLVALRWPMAPYVATLQGLQRQGSVNAVNAIAVTAAYGAGIVLLLAFEKSIVVFFLWHCACAAVQLLALRALAVRALRPESARARFAGSTLLEGWRFALGMTGISLAGVLLAQGDKLILAKLVPLEEFGLYVTALVVAGAMQMIVLPVFNAALPRLAERVAAADEAGLRAAFESSSSTLQALLVPVAVFLILFPYEVLHLWTRDPQIAARAAPVLALLAGGSLLNGLMTIPYALQMARGNTAIGLWIAWTLCVLLVPLIVFLTSRLGILGGALVSPLLNVLYLLFGLPLTYRHCLGSGAWPAFYGALLRQQGAAVALLLVLHWAIPREAPAGALALMLGASLASSLWLSVLCTRDAREALAALWRRPQGTQP